MWIPALPKFCTWSHLVIIDHSPMESIDLSQFACRCPGRFLAESEVALAVGFFLHGLAIGLPRRQAAAEFCASKQDQTLSHAPSRSATCQKDHGCRQANSTAAASSNSPSPFESPLAEDTAGFDLQHAREESEAGSDHQSFKQHVGSCCTPAGQSHQHVSQPSACEPCSPTTGARNERNDIHVQTADWNEAERSRCSGRDVKCLEWDGPSSFRLPRAELRRQVGVRWPAEPFMVSLCRSRPRKELRSE